MFTILALLVGIPICAPPVGMNQSGAIRAKLPPGEVPSRCLTMMNAGERIVDIKQPPFLALLVHPELFDGCVVTVAAYMMYDYPNASLYISAKDRAALGAFFGTVRLSFRNARLALDYNELRRKASLGYVVVQGRFSISGPFGALLDEIQEYHFVQPAGQRDGRRQ